MDYQKQLNRLGGHVIDLVVATPGRLIDFMQRRDVYLDHVEILVLDEADRMLDMGFIPQVKRIVRATPRKENRQTLLFSATFTQDIINLSQQWTFEPVTVEIEPENVATDTVDQRVYMVSSQQRYRVLSNLLRSEEATSVIVFANRRDQVRRLHERLRKSGISCGILSGEIPQVKRTRTLDQCCGQGHSCRGRQSRCQLQPAGGSRRLRAPHWPHRTCRRDGHFHQFRQ
jgi:ATP-dependent RNA helicase RhlB